MCEAVINILGVKLRFTINLLPFLTPEIFGLCPKNKAGVYLTHFLGFAIPNR